MSGALLLLLAAQAVAPVHRSAIIVGVNDAFESEQPTLRYADDDAARYYEMFAPLFDEVALLSVLDEESQQIFAEAASVARPPDARTLRETVARIDERAASARRAGRRTELVFVYVGHGRVLGGEGQVKLLRGALGRTALTQLVLDKTTHDRTHVIIDACNAYHLVNARGSEAVVATERFDDAFERFVDAQSIDRYPSVGVVLSTSGAGATLEWSRLLGGLFSYEVRSALTGAADADENGVVDYTEIEAFLASANVEVPVQRGRPKVYVRAPRIERGAALLVLSDRLPAIELPAELDGHFVLQDDRGVRYAELNKALGYTVSLRLVPRGAYALMNADGGELWRIEAPQGTMRPPLPLDDVVRPSLERGAPMPAGLFAKPYGPEFLVGFLANARLTATTAPPARSTLRPVVAWSALGVAALLVAGATWQGLSAGSDYERYESTSDRTERDRLAGAISAKRRRAAGLGIAGALIGSAGIGVFAWDFVD